MSTTTQALAPEIQRVLIAEACGWRVADNCITKRRMAGEKERSLRGAPPDFGYAPDGWAGWAQGTRYFDLPDFLNDLNAMHEAEKALSRENRNLYIDRLGTLYRDSWEFATATAAQRAEAFLRTIGKWVE